MGVSAWTGTLTALGVGAETDAGEGAAMGVGASVEAGDGAA